eukprot:scaffold2297_cov153-Ochromonas_danica.AAC.7
MQVVYLRRSLEGMGELAHKWIITPRYKLRGDADPVRNNDYVVLKNAQYKNTFLTSFRINEESDLDPLVGLESLDDRYVRSGLKIIRLSSVKDERKTVTEKEVTDGKVALEFVRGGDFVRCLHRENRSHLICRVDDEDEIQSTITPLGSVCRKRMDDKDRVHTVQLRSLAMQQPRVQYDFPVAYSSLGIWQIIPIDSADADRRFHRVPYGGAIRLKHLVTGQYLAIRPIHKSDSKKLKEHTFIQPNGKTKSSINLSQVKVSEGVPNTSAGIDNSEVEIEVDEADNVFSVDEGGGGGSTYNVTIISATASRMKRHKWLGKNLTFLSFSFGNVFTAHTEQCEGNNVASWNLRSKKNEFSFEAKYSDLLNVPLKVNLMQAQTLLGASNMGHGDLLLKDVIIAANHSVMTFTVNLKDKRALDAGSLEIKMEVSHYSSASKSAKSPTFNMKKLLRRDSEIDVSQQPKGLSIRWTVATSTQPNKYTIFKVFPLNKMEYENGDGDYIAYDENIILESVTTSLRLHLTEVQQHLQYSGWWEYSLDRSLIPLAYRQGMIADSDVFHIQRVSPEEVQDTVYASRLLPLARAATATLQLTPSHHLLFEPLFRHFSVALYTFLLWTLGQTECDGSLLPSHTLSEPQLLLDAAHEDTSQHDAEAAEDESSSSHEFRDDDDDGDHDEENDVYNRSFKDTDKNMAAQDTLASSLSKPHLDKSLSPVEHSDIDRTRYSSLAPWVGRAVNHGEPAPYQPTALEDFAVGCMSQFYNRNIPLNAKMIRRQNILFELMLMEQLAQFLNVFFILHRALHLTQDSDMRNAYGQLPSFLENACTAILKLFHACVYKNEKNALKVISIQGMFISLVSQRISGWDAPIESIMEVCREYYSNDTTSPPGQLSVDEVLIRSIHSSDIRQILEQMSWMHMNNHESAENILKLLTLLCNSGKASDHFQNILANLLINCEPSSLELSSSEVVIERRCTSMLFITSFLHEKWHVKFKSQFSMPSQEERSLAIIRKELMREADNLKMLFNVYNCDESNDDVLDLEECFCLLEDLGFGGPFVYEEMGHLLGVSMWGFLHWWCSRAPFYFLSTSVSHSQISPIQAMQLMGMNIQSDDILSQLEHTPIHRDNIMETLQFWGVISSRIPGYNLHARDDGNSIKRHGSRSKPNANLRFSIPSGHPQGVLGIICEQTKKKETKLLLRQPPSQDWISFELALTSAWPDHNWLRSSLILLDAICSGGNIFCQRIVSNLLPPECLLELLNLPNISDYDRHIVCNLLVSVYVNVDFIFPTRSLPSGQLKPSGNENKKDGGYCGYLESIYNPGISIGKVFNPISRVRFQGDGSSSGLVLRAKLFDFIRLQLKNISLSHQATKGQIMYTNALLHLFHTLLAKGFFNEVDFRFFECFRNSINLSDSSIDATAQNKDNEQPNPLSRQASNVFSSKKIDSLEDSFTINRVEEFLVMKLNEALDELRGEDEKLQTKGCLKKAVKHRKSFQGFDSILKRIDAHFLDRNCAAVVLHAVNILSLIHDMKQMMRAQKIWDHCMSKVIHYSLEAYSANIDNLNSLVAPQSLTKPLNGLFREEISDDGITAALFSGTLYRDSSLRKRCYDLINRRLSLPLEASILLDSLHLAGHAQQAFMQRLLDIYIALAVKFVGEVLSPLRNYRDYSMHVLDFVLENITSLLLNRFLEKISQGEAADQRGGLIRFTDDRDKVLGYYLGSSEVPCPGGDDDFFLLDVKKVRMDEVETNFLVERYSSEKNSSLAYNNLKWVLDATSQMAAMVRTISSILIDRYAAHGRPSWQSLGLEEQAAFNRLFSFFNLIGRENNIVRDTIYPLLDQLLIPFYPECPGAVELLHLLLSCSEYKGTNTNIIDILIAQINFLPIDQAHRCKIDLFSALLFNPSDNVYLKTVGLVEDDMATLLRERLQVLHENGDVEDGLVLVKMLTNLVSRMKILPEPNRVILRMLCPIDQLNGMLASDLSLEYKTELVRIATHLYDADILSVERLILPEIRSMRIAMFMLKDANKLEHSRLIFHYITFGVIPAIKQRILESNVIDAFLVNDYIVGEARGLESKLVNKEAARHAANRVASSFPTKSGVAAAADVMKSTSYVPSECINCLTIIINILSFEDACLYRQMDEGCALDLLWICAAIHLMLVSRSDFIFDRITNASIDLAEYTNVARALYEVLQGFILDRMALCTEGYFVDLFQKKCLPIVTGHISSKYDVDKSRRGKSKNEQLLFRQKMNIGVVFSETHLRQTATFRFLQKCLKSAGHFIRLGGLRILEDSGSPQLRSKTFAGKFNSFCNFDIWLKGLGRYLSTLFQHLGDVIHPTQTEYNFLHMLNLLMSTKIENIRNSRFLSQNLKMLMVERERAKLHRTQQALLHLGSVRTVVRVLGRLYVNQNSEYIWKFSPLMLKLGGENLSWENYEAQEAFVSVVLASVEQQKPPECYCMLGLQDLIRKCSMGIISSMAHENDNWEEQQQLNILRASIQLFIFAGALCKGDNTKTQRFLSADGVSSRDLVNITEALCFLVQSIMVRLTEMLTYISNDQFYEKLGPPIYAQKDSTKRRFMEWSNPRNNIYVFAQFVRTVNIAFEELISLCARDSVSEILQALPKTPAILEFLGLMQLKTEVHMSSNSALKLSRSIVWKGCDPLSFNHTYLKEMSRLSLLKADDPEYLEISNVVEDWERKIKCKSRKMSDFAAIFGISKKLFIDVVRKAEYSCLRLLLSCLDCADDQQAMDLLERFNDAILIQNLNSLFIKMGSARGETKDLLTSSTVAYVSLIESIGIYFKSTDELLSLWDREMQLQGITPKSVYGSVELLGSDRRLRRLYFPVPSFVTTYWPYPEVQKVKEEIILQVNRNSPEEKIGDFLNQINRIAIVMKRQERLKLLLTYPVHAVLGGKSLEIIQRYFPRQRAVGLYLAFILNIWFVRANTKPFRPMASRPTYLEWRDWDTQDIVIYSLQFAHFCLMASFTLRTLLNSDAADNLPSLFSTDRSLVIVAGNIIQFPVVAAMVIWDSAWPCVLSALSFFAITGYYWLYVPCLLDVVFQFDDMFFLYVAISRNVLRVGFTCLLAFLCLYFYSIIAYLFFGTQYNLNSYEGCDDPGQCFKLHLDYGLSNSPAWTGKGYIEPNIFIKFPYSRQVAGVIGTIYNLTYIILINLVLQAVISGLIIDTFSSMRAEKEAVEEDIRSKCFICSIGRDDFEQAGVSYTTHILEEHNMWHYAWFKIYLELKDPLSYSSLENYAVRCMKDKQVSHFYFPYLTNTSN